MGNFYGFQYGLRKFAVTAALTLPVLSGRIVDRTTGQPMFGVHVTITGAANATTITNRVGRYTLRNLRPGRYRIAVRGKGMPTVRRRITLSNKNAVANFVVCSVALDYSCGDAFSNGPGTR